MENTISINHTKSNTLEFDLTMEGVETNDLVVRFVIESKEMKLSFEAKKKKGDTWAVKIPRLPMLEKTMYDFCVEVVTDGYFFKPAEGKVNVVGSAELYSTKPKNVTFEPKKEEKVEPKTQQKKEKPSKKTESHQQSPTPKQREKSVEQIARELMEQQDFSPRKIEEKVKEIKTAEKNSAKTGGTKDQQILTILEEVGIKPKRRSKFKFTLPDSLKQPTNE